MSEFLTDVAPAPRTGERQASIDVRALAYSEISAWELFVAKHPAATFFHQHSWARAIELGMGHATHALTAWRNHRLVGILPLTHVPSRLFGDALISAGFAVCGGTLAEDAAAGQALAAAAVNLAQGLGVERVELRHERPVPLPPHWVLHPGPYACFKREISPNDDTNLKAIPRKKRADLRKAIDNHRLRVEVGFEVGDFYALYARSVRDLGTPVYSRRFFEAVKAVFGDAAEISAVVGPKGALAAVITFWFKNRAMPYFGGALPEARVFHAYDLLYWEVMRRAAARDVLVYDFGRSKEGTGAYDYKVYWGFRPMPMGYQHLPLKDGKIGEINPLNPKYRLMVAAWKRLPMPVANLVGPLIARQIG